jgi:hypothetical protein
MVTKISVIVAALLLALIAFAGGGPAAGGLLDPFGLLFLLVAILLWFGWEVVQEGYSQLSENGGRDGGGGDRGSARNRSDLPVIRLGATIIKGMVNKTAAPDKTDSTNAP